MTLAAHAPTSRVLAAVLSSGPLGTPSGEGAAPGRLSGGDAKRVLACAGDDAVAVAVVQHCTDQGVLAELTRRAIKGKSHNLAHALLMSPAISPFDIIELACMGQLGALDKERVTQVVGAASPTPELLAHAVRFSCPEAIAAIARHPDIGADTALALVQLSQREVHPSGRPIKDNHPFLNYWASAPLLAFSRPSAGADPTHVQLVASLRALAATCDPGIHSYDRGAGLGQKVFKRIAETPGLNEGEEFLADDVAEILCSHPDGRAALLGRTDTPAGACRRLWADVQGVPRDMKTEQVTDKLALMKGCPDDVLDALPADAGGGAALARRLPSDPVAWQLALSILEASADRSSVPAVAEVCDVSIVVAAKN